jgi:uncharacterized membrane protein
MDMKKLMTNFLRGLVLVTPIAATFYVLFWVFTLIDGLLPVRIPGLGFVIIIGGVTLLGAASPFLLGNPIISWVRHWVDRVPLVKVIYTAIKDLMAAFVGEKQRFKQPVLVTISRDTGLKKVGFVTQSDLSRLGLQGHVAVYLPHSYNFSGNMFIVRADAVEPLQISGTEAMKFIVSGGVADP